MAKTITNYNLLLKSPCSCPNYEDAFGITGRIAKLTAAIIFKDRNPQGLRELTPEELVGCVEEYIDAR